MTTQMQTTRSLFVAVARERIASEVLPAFIMKGNSPDAAVRMAVELADKLLAKLDEPAAPKPSAPFEEPNGKMRYALLLVATEAGHSAGGQTPFGYGHTRPFETCRHETCIAVRDALGEG
jgi:hypothetical protein